MILSNNSARLITINAPFVNHARTTSFKVLPGNNPNVDVPDELCDNAFVKSLLANGSLVKVGESAKVESTESDEPGQYDEMDKSDLKAIAESFDIEVKSAWSKARIIEEIEKSDAE